MSPSSTVARPVWVLSLPAVAILISFLWFRKKRGSLQTDTGGSGETSACADTKVLQQTPNSCVADEIQQVKEADKELVEPVNLFFSEDSGLIESVVISNQNNTQVSCSPIVNDIEPIVQILGEDITVQVEETPVVCESVNLDTAVETAVIEEDKAPEVASEPDTCEIVEEAKEAVVLQEEPPVEVAVVAGQLEEVFRVVTPKKKDLSDSPSPKWTKNKRGGKNRKKMSYDGGVVEENRGGVALEQQLAKLELNSRSPAQDSGVKRTGGGEGTERDSANNSPSEVMLASPALSGYSDTHSEGSSDSGKGCSEVLTPSPTPVSGNSVSGDVPVTCVYEFVIPQHLVGRLIGRNGSYIHDIKDNTHAIIYIKRHPDTPKLKICAIEGTQMDIDSALDMIRQKFPKKRYPNVTLEAIELPPDPVAVPVLPENLQLYLVEGVNNDVILSSLVSAGHYFLQQPTHPTFLSLARLNTCMAACYLEPNLPALPDDIGPGVLCAAPVHSGWYRAEVTSYPEGEYCDVKFVDYGGYMTILKSSLRQIRADFVTLPFQAAECFLADVHPIGEDGLWCEEAKAVVETLTLGKVLQAQVHGYTEHGIPLIYLYTPCNNELLSVNEELVARGYADWLLPEPVTEECAYVEATTFVETAAGAGPLAV